MKLSIVLAGIVLIICGLIGFWYAATTDVQLNAIIGWILGLILIIIGAYLAGKELKKKENSNLVFNNFNPCIFFR